MTKRSIIYGAESPFDVMGLFQGTGLAQGGGETAYSLPNMVFLYRRAILDYWAEHHETLGGDRDPCAGARNRPSFRAFGRGHGPDR